MCSLQNYLVHIISYHIVNILLLVNVITELGVGKGDGAILTVSLNLKLIKLSWWSSFKLGICDISPSYGNSLIASKSHTVNKLSDIVAKYLISGENLTFDISDYNSKVNISYIPISSTWSNPATLYLLYLTDHIINWFLWHPMIYSSNPIKKIYTIIRKECIFNWISSILIVWSLIWLKLRLVCYYFSFTKYDKYTIFWWCHCHNIRHKLS